MTAPLAHAVTGAYGYSGRFIARALLQRGRRVVTFTSSSRRRRPSDPELDVFPLDFGDPARLTQHLAGVDVLYNTYWVRFNHRRFSHREAVANTLVLFRCAREAGVRRIVHISITNPDRGSPLEYFRGKGELEEALAATGLEHAILRPAVLFGDDDILINNIAWFLRRLPAFGVPGDGRYRLQPIHVDDLAALAVEAGEGHGNAVVNAIGPETFTFRELVTELDAILATRRAIVAVPPWVALAATWVVGRVVGDVVLTAEEIRGLMANTLHVDAAPTGSTRLTDWAHAHRDTLGRRYASELRRRQAG